MFFDVFVGGLAGGEDEVVSDGAVVVTEVEAGLGRLRRVVVDEEVGVGAELDFVKEDVVVTVGDDVDEKILPRFFDTADDGEAKRFELFGDVFEDGREVAGIDRDEADLFVFERGDGFLRRLKVPSRESRPVFEVELVFKNREVEREFVADECADFGKVETGLDGFANVAVFEDAGFGVHEEEDAGVDCGLFFVNFV